MVASNYSKQGKTEGCPVFLLNLLDFRRVTNEFLTEYADLELDGSFIFPELFDLGFHPVETIPVNTRSTTSFRCVDKNIGSGAITAIAAAIRISTPRGSRSTPTIAVGIGVPRENLVVPIDNVKALRTTCCCSAFRVTALFLRNSASNDLKRNKSK